MNDVAVGRVGGPIDLTRTRPPMPSWIGHELSRTLAQLAAERDLSTLLRNHHVEGTEADRAAGALWISKRFEKEPDLDRIIVTNGTKNALFIALATIFGGAGTLLVEEVSYYGFRRIPGFLGIDIKPIAMDEDGALPDSFDRACHDLKPKALYLTPTLHNPTTLVMSRQRRLDLAEVARRHGVAIIEDDVYGLLPRSAPPPIAVLAPDVTWYATGLAKCVAAGLRTGYLIPPSKRAVEALSHKLQDTSTWYIAPLSALVSNAWLNDGTVFRILDAIRDELNARQAVVRELLGRAHYASHPEASHIWLSLPRRWTHERFIKAAADVGVALTPGSIFALDPIGAPLAVRIVVSSPESHAQFREALFAIAPLVEDWR